ncbi:FtsB family cell division protein [Gordonia zhaorongruii]|uniref:FtsB family cell division protein n=1 Tax=Gordonia zhaorongruii TaxID=2597659 RepID=UPI001F1CC197|nr:septum formation initiator family protein [Gordonia zhaorongruii]
MAGTTSGRGNRGRSRSRPAAHRTRARSVDHADDLALIANVVDDEQKASTRRRETADTSRSRPRRGLAGRLGHVSPKRAAIVALVIVVLALTLAVPVRTYLSQRSEFNELRQSNAALEAEVAEYKSKIDKQNDPAYIEAQARQRLQYVKRGEKQVIVISPAKEQREAAEKAERERAANPWYQNMWDAVATPPEGK